MKLFECTFCGYIKEFEAKPDPNGTIRCPICGERNCWEEKEVKNEKNK